MSYYEHLFEDGKIELTEYIESIIIQADIFDAAMGAYGLDKEGM